MKKVRFSFEGGDKFHIADTELSNDNHNDNVLLENHLFQNFNSNSKSNNKHYKNKKHSESYGKGDLTLPMIPIEKLSLLSGFNSSKSIIIACLILFIIGKTKQRELSNSHDQIDQLNELSKEVTLTDKSEPLIKKKKLGKSSKSLFFNQNDIETFNLKKVISFQPSHPILDEDDEFPNTNPNKINKFKIKQKLNKVNSAQKDIIDINGDRDNDKDTIDHFDIYDKPVYNEHKFILPLNTVDSVNTMINEKLKDKNFMKSNYNLFNLIIEKAQSSNSLVLTFSNKNVNNYNQYYNQYYNNNSNFNQQGSNDLKDYEQSSYKPPTDRERREASLNKHMKENNTNISNTKQFKVLPTLNQPGLLPELPDMKIKLMQSSNYCLIYL